MAAGASLKFRKPLRWWLDRKFFQEQYDREEVLLGVSEEIGKLGSMVEVSRFVGEQLDFAQAVYVWHRGAKEMMLAYSSDRRPVSVSLPSDGKLPDLLETNGAILEVPAPKAGLSRSESRWLAQSGIRLIVPSANSNGRLVGMLMLGEKRSEEPYSPGDPRLLQAIARQMATAQEALELKAQVDQERRIQHDVLARLDPALGNLLKECPSCGVCFDGGADTCDRDGQTLTLSLPVARMIDGRYRLDHLIGKGGMGAVYEAWDLRLERRVAVKIMIDRAFCEERALRRFQAEARATARLNHPNIVSVYDYGALDGGGGYLVMERIRGMTLRAEIDRACLPPATAADWFVQVLDGVAAAHTHRIVHRDLKPENVVGRRPRWDTLEVKILDFGLAKFRPFDTIGPGSFTLTEDGMVMGTFGYMPPEQLLRQEVDERADIFALGVMLVEMLTGRRPFTGNTYGEISRAIFCDTYRLPGGSQEIRDLDGVLQRCLAKMPQDRFSSVEALGREIIPRLRVCPGLQTD